MNRPGHAFAQRMRAMAQRPLGWCVLLAVPFVVLIAGTHHPFALDDGLRHLVMARQFRALGIAHGGNWGAYFFAGYFASHTVDPWFLSDLAYVPFTFLPNGVLALKAATLVFLMIVFLSAALLLRTLRLPPLLGFLFLVALFFGSENFTQRLLTGRPFVLMTAVFLLTYACVLQRRFLLLAPLLAVATLLSHLFVFPLALCAIAAAWFWIIGRRRESLSCAACSIAGVAAGLVLHPHPVAYLSYIWTVFLRMPFVHEGIGVPGEMLSGLNSSDISLFMGILCVMLLSKLCAYERIWRKHIAPHRPDILLSLLLFFFFLATFFLWLRSVDYFWPLTVVLAMQLSTATPRVTGEVLRSLRTPAFFLRWRFTWLHLLIAVCLVNIGDIGMRSFATDRSRDVRQFSAIQEVPTGSRVLNVDWDILPPLLFLNSSVLYARGMDPAFDVYQDPQGAALSEELLERWRWNWSQPRASLSELWSLYRFPWYLQIIHERGGMNLPLWVDNLRRHYPADYLVVSKWEHPRNAALLRNVLPIFSESSAITVFVLKPAAVR